MAATKEQLLALAERLAVQVKEDTIEGVVLGMNQTVALRSEFANDGLYLSVLKMMSETLTVKIEVAQRSK